MMHPTFETWLALLALGMFHGVNPGMGWLFAVALGMQERSHRAVVRALLPLGAGHALAVAAAVAVAMLVGAVIPLAYLRWVVAGVLAVLGISRLYRHRHPRWAQMQVGPWSLTLWSFLMASAHGAGLMVVPVFLSMATVQADGACHVHSAPISNAPEAALFATTLHAAGYLAVTAIVALVVFHKLGLSLLRRAWFNLDLIWASALIVTGCLTVFLPLVLK
jgi:hypothetical protein